MGIFLYFVGKCNKDEKCMQTRAIALAQERKNVKTVIKSYKNLVSLRIDDKKHRRYNLIIVIFTKRFEKII